MAISTFKTFLMKKTADAYTKLCDIKSYPDLGGAPEMIDVTTLSDKMRQYVPGVQEVESMQFETNYTLEEYKTVKALEGQTLDLAVWFGGTEQADGTVTPTGDNGKFEFKGSLSIFVNGGAVNESVNATITVAPSSVIALAE